MPKSTLHVQSAHAVFRETGGTQELVFALQLLNEMFLKWRFSLLILIIAFGSTPAFPCDPEALRRLSETYLTATVTEVGLPESLLKVSAQPSTTHFSLIHMNWQNMDFKGTHRALKKVAKQKKKDPITSEDQKVLKLGRKTIDLLRQGYDIFEEGGRPPRKVKQFTSAFGELNDLIANKQWEAAKKIAKKLRKQILSLKEKDFTRKFSPGSPALSLKEIAEGISENLQEETNTIPIDFFHDIRKEMKRFMNYFRVEYSLNPTEENKAAFEYLKNLNQELGTVNDEAVKQSYQGVAYESQTVTLDNGLKSRILNFLDKLEFEEIR